MSRWGPCSPASTRRARSALMVASPPTRSSRSTRRRPRASGSTSQVVTSPSRSSTTVDGPVVVSSSSPSPPWTISARSAPLAREHAGHALGHAQVGHADQVALDPAGVGERTEDVEGGGDAEVAPGRAGVAHGRVVAGREAEPDARLGHARRHAGRGRARWRRRAPRAGRRRRRPTTPPGCRACTPGRPAPATTSAEMVLTLIVWARSPPVPTTSITGPLVSMSTRVDASSMASTIPPSSVDGLALHAQGDDEGGDLGGAGRAVEDLRHGDPGRVGVEVAALHEGAEDDRPPSVRGEASGQPSAGHRTAGGVRKPGGVAAGCGGAPSRWPRPTRLPSPGLGGRTPGRSRAPSTRCTPPWRRQPLRRWLGRRSRGRVRGRPSGGARQDPWVGGQLFVSGGRVRRSLCPLAGAMQTDRAMLVVRRATRRLRCGAAAPTPRRRGTGGGRRVCGPTGSDPAAPSR